MYRPHRRRGRPHHHRSTTDKGTKELQQKRKKLLERGDVQDFFLAESLLGILYAHEAISKPLYEAGRFFGELGYRYEPCLGYTFRPRASVLAQIRNGALGKGQPSFSDKQDERQTKAWRRALKALQEAGPHPYKIVLKVVFYDQDLYTTSFPSFLLKEVGALRQGLECLEAYFNEGLKGKRDKLDDRALNPGKATTSQPFLKVCQSLVLL